jgi:hypothetical protein
MRVSWWGVETVVVDDHGRQVPGQANNHLATGAVAIEAGGLEVGDKATEVDAVLGEQMAEHDDGNIDAGLTGGGDAVRTGDRHGGRCRSFSECGTPAQSASS